MSLWLLRIGVSVVARTDILPVDGMLAELRVMAGEEVAAWIEAIDLKSDDGLNVGLSANAEKQVQIYGKAYSDLVAFVTDQEEKIAIAASQGGAGSTAGPAAPISTVPVRSFENDMVLVSRKKRDGDALEWAWVRRANQEKWKTRERPISSAQQAGSGPP